MWWIRWFLQSRLERGWGHLLFFFWWSVLRWFGPLPHRHHKPRVDSLDFRSSSWMECLPRGFCRIFSSFDSKSRLQLWSSGTPLFLSSDLLFHELNFTWISILFTLWSQNTLSERSIFCPNSHKRHVQKISLNKPNALFSRDNALLCKHQCWSDLACIGKKMMQVHNTQEGTTNHRETQKVVWFVGQKGGCVWRE